MKYKIQTVAAGKKPNDDMCKAIEAMFPPFVNEENVHLTRADEPGSFISQSDQADYTIEGEASTIASEVRSTAMAAFRYRNKHYKGRNYAVDGDVVMTDVDAQDAAAEGAGRITTPGQDESDAALIGLESESEEEQDESEAEGGDEAEDGF
jgi:hypothetical protein